jgi:hypothetical protein
MPFLIGMGEDVQMQYRLLPVSEYANIGVYKARKNNSLPTENLVILHAGAVHGVHKASTSHILSLLCIS